MALFFRRKFAESGDKTAIPEDTQTSGAVSYQEGFGFDYQRNPDGSDPLALNIPRDQFNELMFDITGAVQQYQTHGVPDFITSGDNGGVAYPYDKFAKVRYDDGGGVDIYTSLQDSNTALPSDATKWQRGSAIGITNLTGDVVADGPGSVTATIQPNAVTTPKIIAQAVTLAKMAAISAYSFYLNATGGSASPTTQALANKQLAGRGDATTGSMGAIAVGTGLDIVGNTLINTIPAPTPVNSNQLAKAWVRFGTNGNIINSYNVSSITYGGSGTGLYTLNFASPMANINYVWEASAAGGVANGSGPPNSGIGNFYTLAFYSGDTNTVNALQLRGGLITINGNPSSASSLAQSDVPVGMVVIYGN